MDGQGANSLGHWSNNGALVVGELKLVKIVGKKILSVDACEIEVIEGRGVIGCCRAHEAFKIINGVVLRCQKEKF